jgi:hypothetical protein
VIKGIEVTIVTIANFGEVLENVNRPTLQREITMSWCENSACGNCVGSGIDCA